LTGRQGYPDPLWVRVSPVSVAPTEDVQITRSDTPRLDNIWDFDARIEKEFTFQDFGLTLGVDCFNVFNQAFILQRRERMTRSGANVVPLSNTDWVNEVLSPRIFRFGARISFK